MNFILCALQHPWHEYESGRELFGFYFRKKDISDHQIEESLLTGGSEGLTPAWKMGLGKDIADGEKVEPLERDFRSRAGSLRFPAWTTACLRRSLTESVGIGKLASLEIA